ncbi:MAG: prepilin-type N-terminal cleavage/methylation domain-containing protein [Candidatus Komeilibacteria bacterium]
MKNKGFTLIEILVVIGIIGILSTMVIVSLGSVRYKARDTKRINDLSQIGRFLSFGCLVPADGVGEYDLNDLIAEYKAKYPQQAHLIPSSLKDPKTGNSNTSNYTYIINEENDCALYANLENTEAEVNLTQINEATPKGGIGIFKGVVGVNGSNKYYQVSN